ncbi:MAG TPA: hypothetical protein VL418_15400 [Devosiaceae bacterium]|nr:hypothetical protein [Devosiaceae bacterium]
MKKIMSLAAGAALLVASSIGVAMPAMAAMGPGHDQGRPDPGREQAMVMRWCHDNPRDGSCGDFNRHHNRWSEAQYHSWYQSHRGRHGVDPAAAAFFGFSAAVGSAIAHSNH